MTFFPVLNYTQIESHGILYNLIVCVCVYVVGNDINVEQRSQTLCTIQSSCVFSASLFVAVRFICTFCFSLAHKRISCLVTFFLPRSMSFPIPRHHISSDSKTIRIRSNSLSPSRSLSGAHSTDILGFLRRP